MRRHLAFLISRILGPLPLLCLLWLTTAVKSGIGFWKALWVYPVIFLIGIALPTLVSLVVLKIKKLDFEWTNLKDRYLLIPIYLPFWIISLVLIWRLTNTTIFHLSLLMATGVVGGIFVYVFLRFKMSAHMVIASGVFWGVNFMTHNKLWWLFLLLIPIFWARIKLKQHTWEELAAGLIFTNGLTILALLLFGWPAVP